MIDVVKEQRTISTMEAREDSLRTGARRQKDKERHAIRASANAEVLVMLNDYFDARKESK